MRKLNEETKIITGKALSLMLFIDIGYIVEKQRGMISIAFPTLGNQGLYKILKGFSQNQNYLEKKDELLGISERFFNNGPLKLLYKSLGFLMTKETPSSELDAKKQDVNRVLAKIERMINGKLTSDERDMFSGFSGELSSYASTLSSKLGDSIQASVQQAEPESEPKKDDASSDTAEKPETPAETPKSEPAEEPKTQSSEPVKSEPKKEPAEKPKAEPVAEPNAEEPKEKEKTEEHFRNLIKKLVRESLKVKLKRK